MAGKKLSSVLLAVLLTALLAGGFVYLLMDRQVTRLKEEASVLESANTRLQEQLESLQREIGTLPRDVENGDMVISRKPRSGWEDYFPTPGTTTLEGETVERVRELLGEPPVLLRSTAENPAYSREIWIFMPFDEDPTGLYLYFKGNRLTGSRLDEFTGLPFSGLLDDEDFWY